MDTKTRNIIHDRLLEVAHIKDMLPDYQKSYEKNADTASRNLYVSMSHIEKVLADLQEQEENDA